MSAMLHSHAIEAEQGILGGILLTPSVLAELDLVPADFFNSNNRQVFEAILAVSKHQPVDLVTVCQHLETITGRDWAASLGQLVSNTPSAALVPEYARILREKTQLIRAQNLLLEYRTRIPQEGLPAIDELAGALMQIGMVGQSHEHSMADMLRASVDDLEARRNGAVSAITTGLVDLDHTLGGLHDTDLIVVAARPAMGKTAVLLNLALNSGVAGGLISTEQPLVQIGHRLLAREAQVAVTRLRDPKTLTDQHWSLLSAAMARLHDRGNFWINDNCASSVADVVRQARKWRHAYGIRALWVDYIQRLKPADPKLPKYQQVGETVRALKDLARELEIPVVALAQVNREVEKRTDKRPHMGDISDSSEIEKEADQIMTLYRDEVYNPQTMDAGIMEIRIEKNRHGPTGTTKVHWQPEIMAVRNLAREA